MGPMDFLGSPEEFSFPFTPYDIQKDFMKALFEALEAKKLGIFESPTGTGKSLSLICGALTWLKSHSEHEKEELIVKANEEIEGDDGVASDWFASANQRRLKEEKKKVAAKQLEQIMKQENRIKAIRKQKQEIHQTDYEKRTDEFNELFKEVEQVRKNVKKELELSNSEISSEEAELILDDIVDEVEENNEDDEDDGCLKIFYCSRTHSQLTQFIREIQKTSFKNDVRVSALASRQNLCVNETVSQLSSLSLINERCLELQKGKNTQVTKQISGRTEKKRKVAITTCPFKKQIAVQHLSNQILTEVQDLEQLVTTGKKTKGCPYYASRKSIKDSQLVVVPYNSILHRSTRESSNIKLKNNIVIVDEAHNLLETIANIHSAVLSCAQVCGAHSQLTQYLKRYNTRLSAQNCLYIEQIIFFLKAFMKLLTKESSKESSRLLTLQQLLGETYTDNLNIFELVKFIESSKIANKLHGFSKFFEGQVINGSEKEKSSTSDFLAKLSASKSKVKPSAPTPPIAPPSAKSGPEDGMVVGSPLLGVAEFLKAIVCGSSDGRVVVNLDDDKRKTFVKFLLLNPASKFHEIVKECRSVIVAGGTMSPMSEFRDQLFLSAGASMDRVLQFSCGHVVEDKNILPLVLKAGPGNINLDFTYNNRRNPDLLDELGRILQNLSNVIPGGIVVFFPSYDYEELVNRHLSEKKIIRKLSVKKRVFREPKKSMDLDKVLNEFSQSVKEGVKGAILFCVVGGKMSEGINFSDDLGRCVVMVGLPYPNKHSPELIEKMKYLNCNYAANEKGDKAGDVFYDNLCFKAVNQSIGRSIRHKWDYSSIVLLDQRYARDKSIAALPRWISSRTEVCDKFGLAFGKLKKFFDGKKS